MERFEERLLECRGAVERFVRFKISNAADAEDVTQEVFAAACLSRGMLRSDSGFKSWLLGIARNKCGDYYRKKATAREVELKDSRARRSPASRFEAVHETLDKLSACDRQMLTLYYAVQLPQAEIAARLGIPLGTVKSRLHTARENFRKIYPYPPNMAKGDAAIMKKLPEKLPEYTIERLDEAPFEVRCEEMPGWMIVPREGEKLTWGLYEMPGRDRTEWTEMEAAGRAEIHGETGAEITAVQHNASDYYRTGSVDGMMRRFVVQLTDTHCRVLAESHIEDGVRKCHTFLDGDAFISNWGYGPDNCGIETSLKARGQLVRRGNEISGEERNENADVVGRYRVTIGRKTWDTICVVDAMCFNDGVLSEQFVDENGRTVLWRRFNADDWAFFRYGKLWSDMLPDNQRLTVNGSTFVHWYDCITDYIL